MSWLTGVDDDDEEYSEYDESAVRVRPNPKANKPRTKIRPDHAGALSGRVFSVDRGRYGVWVEENTPDERQLVCTRARELGKKSVVTGDWSTWWATPPVKKAVSPASCGSSHVPPCCAEAPTTRMP